MAVKKAQTYWETVAFNRWGQYLTATEKAAVDKSMLVAGAPGTALEIGCDSGRWSKLLFDHGWSIICTDINQASLEICQQRIPEARCIHVESSEQHLPCQTGEIRLIICIEVEEVMESDWLVSEAYRVLQSGGLLVGVFFNRTSPRGLFVRLTARFHLRDKNYYPSYRKAYEPWKRILLQEGFKILHERGMCWFPFVRSSNSPLIPLALHLEESLGLHKIPALSPWIVFIAQKM